MSLYSYRVSKEITTDDFEALIMAAMRRADSANIVALRAAFPSIYAELDARYNAPGGLLEGEA